MHREPHGPEGLRLRRVSGNRRSSPSGTPAADVEFLVLGEVRCTDTAAETVVDGAAAPTPARLTKAALQLANIPFVIIGNGPDEDHLKQMSQELGLNNVHFVGPKWGAELEDYLNKAKFVVVPSLWQETFPYVILQAFAACKPVIGTKRGGIPEMIGDDRGLLYEATDEKELSKLIKKMYESEMMRKEMGAAGRKYIEDNFTDDCFYSVLKANYDRALSL